MSLATFSPGFGKDKLLSRSWVSYLCFFLVWMPCVSRPPQAEAYRPRFICLGCTGLPACSAMEWPGVYTWHTYFYFGLGRLRGGESWKANCGCTDQAAPKFLFVLWEVWVTLRVGKSEGGSSKSLDQRTQSVTIFSWAIKKIYDLVSFTIKIQS